MTNGSSVPVNLVNVRGTKLLASDTRERYRQKLARITLDSMVQFVGLLDAQGTVLEINQVALDAVGIKLSDVEGKPFWTTFWWQVSEEINATLRESIRRAAQGEFVRWDTEIYGRAGGKETIIIDASLMPVKDEHGNVAFITAEGRDITEKKAHEREIARQREELAQLDKPKTQFFANISHEFRTPLTLMMGPLEDALAQPEELSVSNRERLELAHRNSLRLLKLVNTLLDFSRIEAGRIHASYEPTDLAQLTAELASVFRSAIERAGMRLVIQCPTLPNMVYVDREMWEKIVLNLLSNAFKFTFKGEIEVSLQAVDSGVEMTVRDTGTGIPEEEIPHVFERFHRVKGACGRSYEGSGIGLALVRELVELHGGTITVESTIGKGTTFRVRLLLGKAHLPPEHLGSSRQLASTAVRAEAFVEEALRWQTEHPSGSLKAASANSAREPDCTEEFTDITSGEPAGRVLVVDDNADMCDYLRRLLAHEYHVLTAANGEEALKVVQAEHPDLVLTDIMMPGVDGFAVLRALRTDPSTRTIPVIFLSARAGEEASIEGRAAGADDYLVKPFSARELLARVGAQLKLTRARTEAEARIRASEERFRALVSASSDVVFRMSPDWDEMRQLDGRAFSSDTGGPNRNWMYQYIHPEDQLALQQVIQKAIQTKTPFELEHRVRRLDGTSGWVLSRAVPVLSDAGEITEWFGAASDVTGRKQVEEALRQSEERFRAIVETTPDCVKVVAPDGTLLHMNSVGLAMVGTERADTVVGKSIYDLIAPEDRESFRRFNQRICRGEKGSLEFDIIGLGGLRHHMESHAAPFRNSDGATVQLAVTRDVSKRKQSEEARHRLAAIVEGSDDAIVSKTLKGIVTSWNAAAERMFGYKAEEMIGQPIARIIPPELQDDEQLILDTIGRGERIEHFETVRVKKNGERIEVSLTISPVRDEAGTIIGAAKIARDITQQKKTEQALRTTERLASVGRLAATVAHEVNNPLEAVTNLIYLARRVAVMDEVREYLSAAEEELDRISHLTKQTLGFYRDSKEAISTRPGSMVTTLVPVFASKIRNKGVTLQSEIRQDPEIVAIPGEIRQLLANLISNSIDAVQMGGRIRIRVSAATERTGQRRAGVRLTVADSGPGIPAAIQSNLFQPFFTTKKDVGTGLGLWVCKSIVEKHAGRIQVRSSVAPGRSWTVFSVFLPQASQVLSVEQPLKVAV